MKGYGSRSFGLLRLGWDLKNIPHPTIFTWWELESMGIDIGIGDGHSDDIVSVAFTVPESIVRVVNRAAGYDS